MILFVNVIITNILKNVDLKSSTITLAGLSAGRRKMDRLWNNWNNHWTIEWPMAWPTVV